MNSGPTAERVYQALKARVRSGAFRPGERLDPAQLADMLASSATPVREALCLLTGEGLIEARTGGGFHAAAIDPPALQDLYAWCLDLLMLAERARPNGLALPTDGRSSYAEDVAALFNAVGAGSGNVEHRRALASLNDRLYRARAVEERVLDRCVDELAALRQALATADRRAIKAALARYTRRRVGAAAQIVRALYRTD